MTQSKHTHTAGPWVIHPVKRGLQTQFFFINGEEDPTFTPLVCKVDFGAQKMSDPGSAEINEANARLIAASPTMYDFIADKARSGDAGAIEMLDLLGLAYNSPRRDRQATGAV